MEALSLRSRMSLAVRQAVAGVAFRAMGKSLKPASGWIPLAQVEDPDDSAYPEEEQLWASRMRTMVANFDAIRFRPPVIRPDGGPAHYTGEHADPCGFVTALDFDGVTLWGKLIEISDWGDGRIESCVAKGYWGRSIGFWFAYNGKPDNFKLRHLALLGGEPEGQADQGLPPLTRFFKSAYAGMPDGGPYMQEATRAAAEPFASRSYPRTPAPADRSATPQEDQMDDTKLEALLDKFAKRTTEETNESLRTAMAPLEQKITKQEETMASLRSDLDAARTASTAAQEAAAAAVATQEATAKRSKEQGYRSRLSALTASFRVAEGEIPQKVEVLMALPDELAEKEIAAIEAREPAVSEAGRTVLTIADGANTSSFRVAPGIDASTAESYYRAGKLLPKDARPEIRVAAYARAGMVDPLGFLN